LSRLIGRLARNSDRADALSSTYMMLERVRPRVQRRGDELDADLVPLGLGTRVDDPLRTVGCNEPRRLA
jgi:hypothetical protein